MRKNKIKRLTALFLSFCLVLPLFMSSAPFAIGTEGSTVEITTAKQLNELSKRCSTASYSENLIVKFLNDIDLKGGDFSPIPVFNGIFDGQGFEIKGFNISEGKSGSGFFNIIGENAEIKNLRLSGSVTREQDSGAAGLLSSENYGYIENCSVYGELSGFSFLGSVTGINHSGASIFGCLSETTVKGLMQAGGIAGINFGKIENSKNLGFINTSFEAEILPVDFSRDKNEVLEIQAEAFLDVGGIVGVNFGGLKSCENSGEIGETFFGKNIGGIAGSNQGLISQCENTGDVSGALNVGGIAGFFSPEFDLVPGNGLGSSFDLELETLVLILQNLSDSLLSSPSFKNESQDIKDHALNIDSALMAHFDGASETLSKAMKSLSSLFRDISAAAKKLSSLCSDFSKLSADEIGQTQEYIQTILPVALESELNEDMEYMQTELESINLWISSISETAEKLSQLSQRLDESFYNEELTEPQKKDALLAVLKSYYETTEENIIFAEASTNISASFSVINRSINIFNSKLTDNTPEISSALRSLTASAARLQRGFTDFSQAADDQSKIVLSGIYKTELTLRRYVSMSESQILLAFNEIYVILGLVQKSLLEISSRLPESRYEVSALIDSAAIQLKHIGSIALSMVTEPEFSSFEASPNLELNERPGQISASINSGTISAYENVGGIAGLMSMSDTKGDGDEYPDYLWSENPSLFRALLMNCENRGNIIGEKNFVGGIAGYCKIGVIYKTESEGQIKSAKGSYCGGIAGVSRNLILQSSALGKLSGGDYLGGIAGEGQNIANCRSMVLISGKGENHGCIAGDAYGETIGNAFVEEGLGGIKGRSFAGRAYPLPYESFIALENLPSMFTRLHGDFYLDGELLKTVFFEYGSSIDSWQIPKLPEREDGFGQWENFSSSNLIRSFKVNAFYTPWLEGISSGGESPLLMAKGKFSNKATLKAQEEKLPLYSGKAHRGIAAFSYTIKDEYADEDTMYSLRLLCESPRNPVLLISHNGQESKIIPSRSGDYLVFTAPFEAEIVVLESIAGRLVAVSFIILSVFVALGFFWYYQKHFPKPVNKSKK